MNRYVANVYTATSVVFCQGCDSALGSYDFIARCPAISLVKYVPAVAIVNFIEVKADIPIFPQVGACPKLRAKSRLVFWKNIIKLAVTASVSTPIIKSLSTCGLGLLSSESKITSPTIMSSAATSRYEGTVLYESGEK